MRPIPQYDAKAWLLKAMRETARAMEAIIWEADEADLERATDPDEWSAKQQLSHMCEMERRYIGWLECIAREDDARLKPFDGDSIEPEVPLDRVGVYELMEEFGALRQQCVYLLWSLDEYDWERTGEHPYLGPRSILDIAREMNEHDLAHLWQLRRTCDRFAAVSA